MLGYRRFFVVTLPCDRSAALAALDAAIASTRRNIVLAGFLAVIVGVFGVATLAWMQASMPPLGGEMFSFIPLFTFIFIVVALLIPLAAYLSTRPWLTYLEELRRGIESGTVDLDKVCGQPIYWQNTPSW